MPSILSARVISLVAAPEYMPAPVPISQVDLRPIIRGIVTLTYPSIRGLAVPTRKR